MDRAKGIQELTLQEANAQLSTGFLLPAPSKAELSVPEAQAAQALSENAATFGARLRLAVREFDTEISRSVARCSANVAQATQSTFQRVSARGNELALFFGQR